MAYKIIKGTFLDEITHDIASQNWGEKEWTLEFDTMAEAGIDTVVLIRAGYRERLAYPSVAIPKHVRTLPLNEDLIDLFLSLCGSRDITFFLGTYDSGRFWRNYEWRKEVEVNRELIREVWDCYGGHPALGAGISPTRPRHVEEDPGNPHLSCRGDKEGLRFADTDLTLLLWPVRSLAGIYTSRCGRTPQRGRTRRVVGGVLLPPRRPHRLRAFQDGTAEMLDLEAYVSASAELARRHGVEPWSNLETFDRDVPMKFPPIDSRKLIYKLETVQPYVSKVITFEFSHFMSPNSMWPSARMLYQRYREFVASRRTQGQARAQPKTGRNP